jgi:hypothetical protein
VDAVTVLATGVAAGLGDAAAVTDSYRDAQVGGHAVQTDTFCAPPAGH